MCHQSAGTKLAAGGGTKGRGGAARGDCGYETCKGRSDGEAAWRRCNQLDKKYRIVYEKGDDGAAQSSPRRPARRKFDTRGLRDCGVA